MIIVIFQSGDIMSKRTMTEGTPWKHIVSFALPVLAGSLLQQLYNTADSVIVGRNAGQSALSGVGTTGTFTFLFLAIAIGFSSGNSVVIAQHYGAGKPERVRQGARQTTLISVGITILIAAAIMLTAPKIIDLFALNHAAADYCIQHLRTIAMVNLVLSVYIPLFGVFQGTNHSTVPTIVATCALTVRVIVTYIFRYSDFFGYTIIWWNGLFGFGTGCTITWSYYLSGKWLDHKSAFTEKDSI